jgi:hypothetical protein
LTADQAIGQREARQQRRLAHVVGGAGALFAVLGTAAIMLLREHPPTSDTDAQVTAWLTDPGHQSHLLTGLHLAVFSIMFFLWYVAAVSTRVAHGEERFLSAVFLASGVLFAACMLAASAAWGGMAVAAQFLPAGAEMSASTVLFGHGLAYSLAMVHGVRMASVFTIATCTLGLRTGTLPRPLALLGYGIAFILIFWVSYLDPLVLLFPVWLFFISLVILYRAVRQNAR